MTSAPYTIEKVMVLKNKRGLHARAASKFVKIAKRFAAQVTVTKQEQTVSGHSIMGLMMLAAPKGTQINVRCEGPEADLAIAALTELIRGRFGEE